MNYYIQGDPSRTQEIKAAFEKLGIDALDFGFTDKTLVYCSIGGCVQPLPYSINLMHILYSHPDYQELELPVESKFKVGDWAVFWDKTYQILGNESTYLVRELNGLETRYEYSTADENGHLWTIADAEDGDVLFSKAGCPFIFREDIVRAGLHNIMAYCGIDTTGTFIKSSNKTCWTYDLPKPATKEQRVLLFKKMQEAGYQWDVDKKELHKIKPHYDIANFKAGMPVLVRDGDEHKWLYTIFGIYNKENSLYPFVVVNMRGYEQCIPFEGNKHLLGTTDMPSEEFINW